MRVALFNSKKFTKKCRKLSSSLITSETVFWTGASRLSENRAVNFSKKLGGFNKQVQKRFLWKRSKT